MKKIYSYMFAAVAMFAVVACEKENAENGAPSQNIPADAIEKTFSAALVDDVKTVISGSASLWSGTESISVLGKSSYQFTTTLEKPSASATFTCSAYSASEEAVMAVYPYKANYTVDLTNRTVSNVVIPTTQKAPKGSYDSSAHIAVAYSEDGENLAFKNAVSLFKFTPQMDNLKKVCIYIPETSKGSVVGTGKVAYNDGAPTFTATTSGKYVDVLPSTGTYFVKGETYYFAVMPGSYPDGFTFEITTSTAQHVYMKTVKAQTLVANKVYDMGGIIEPTVAVVGDFNNWAVGTNAAVLENGYYVAKNVKISKESEFKVIINGNYYRTISGIPTLGRWIGIYKIDGNPSLSVGTYDIYIKKESYEMCVLNSGTKMPTHTSANSEYYIVMKHLWSDWDYMLYVSPNVGWGATNSWPGIYCEGNFYFDSNEYKYWKVASGANGKTVLFVFADYKDDGNTQQSKDVLNVSLTSDYFYYFTGWDHGEQKASISELNKDNFR